MKKIGWGSSHTCSQPGEPVSTTITTIITVSLIKTGCGSSHTCTVSRADQYQKTIMPKHPPPSQQRQTDCAAVGSVSLWQPGQRNCRQTFKTRCCWRSGGQHCLVSRDEDTTHQRLQPNSQADRGLPSADPKGAGSHLLFV